MPIRFDRIRKLPIAAATTQQEEEKKTMKNVHERKFKQAKKKQQKQQQQQFASFIAERHCVKNNSKNDAEKNKAASPNF